ncbi:RHS repeat-associated core domain-containing protein [Pseudomonas kermanshahensis]|uniref:RHS repeat-associated core domain-containing protein n=1 Tax=Pseudomonas kermanshahensis TaxID=2745482 RepID=A0ABU8R696_9PSED|nr:RHS repeat-associated core domain-containing protein [Pseudomonas sp. SWRI50]MBC3496593.1 RHS repeat-associated core domain-containing protein [Pseudomonas sp. SWRI67]MBV4529792.1 RHS repeat-associated core domain-containing protein [Pseudomonas kermanshahensis]
MRHTRSRSYTAWGAVCGVVSGSRLAFCGEYRDALAGHYLLGNGRRAYNPALMRFNSADTLSPFGRGGINTYAYCLNDPINRVDRNGAFSFPNSVYFAVLAESALNVVDGLMATLKLIVQSRQLGSTPSFKQQVQVLAKTQKGIAKIAASAFAWKEQGAPTIPSVTESAMAGAVATGLGITERFVNLKLSSDVVVPYLWKSPGQIPGVVVDLMRIQTGISPVQTIVSNVVQKIRGNPVGTIDRA